MIRKTICLLFCAVVFGPAFAQPAADPVKLQVVTSVFPIEYLVQRVGGERVSVSTFLETGQDCHSFDPRPSRLRMLADADLFVGVGVAYEDALLNSIRNAYPHLQVLPLGVDPQAEQMQPLETLHSGGKQGRGGEKHDQSGHTDHAGHEGHDHHDHQHHHDHHESHADEGDVHTWTSPGLAAAHARAVTAALSELDPVGEAIYRENLLDLEAEIERLRNSIAARLDEYEGRAFLVYHPAFGHFADAFGLRQIAVQWEGKDPSPRRFREILQTAREAGVACIVVQPQEASTGVERLAAQLAVDVLEVDPMNPDWPEMMLGLADGLEAAFRKTEKNERE